MQTRQLGQFQVSVVGLGCNNFGMTIDEAATKAVVDAALDAGINYFDTADIYGGTKSEQFLGRALGSRRDDIVLATKFGHSMGTPEGRKGGSRSWIMEAVDASLQRLGTDRIDHIQIHEPDAATPIEETLGALNELVQAGKVVELGCSNFSATQLDDAANASQGGALPPFRTVQNRYSVLYRAPEKDGVLGACERLGVGFVPFFPLESGLLTGKYTKGADVPEGSRLANPRFGKQFLSDDRLDQAQLLSDYAAERGHNLLELALSWLVSNPTISTVIAGATKPEQIAANTAAANAWAMTAQERSEIDALLTLG